MSLRYIFLHQDLFIYTKIYLYTSRFTYIHQDLFIYNTIYLSISRFIYIHQVSYISAKISLHQDPYSSRLWQAYLKYQVKLICLVNSWLQEPRKMVHVIPNLRQFFKAFLRELYEKQLKDLTGATSPIEQEPSLTVFMPSK